MAGQLHKTELWDKRTKDCTKSAKDFSSSVSDGTVQTKADVEENDTVHHTNVT